MRRSAEGILAALELQEGSPIADIGCGGGFHTRLMSDRVGAKGRMFAVDIDSVPLMQWRAQVAAKGSGHVEIILGKADDPRLPWGTLDAALMVLSYHEMTEHEAMWEEVRRALKPGGLPVMVESEAPDPGTPCCRELAPGGSERG